MAAISFFRVVIRQNEILSCFPTTQTTFINEDNVLYESDINKLTFALVKAESDHEAIQIAERMLNDRRKG